jgi:hypothetical protein
MAARMDIYGAGLVTDLRSLSHFAALHNRRDGLRVLNGANADHWIKVASIRSRVEIKQLVQEHLAESAGRKLEGSTAKRVKTFKFRDDPIKTVQAAIDRAKKIAGAEHDSAALAVICEDYAEGRTALTPDSLVEFVADYLSSLDADERAKFRAVVNARVTPAVSVPQAG